MIDKQKISNQEWAELAAKCMGLLGDDTPKDNHIIVSSRLYEKIMQIDGVKKKFFKKGKWRNK